MSDEISQAMPTWSVFDNWTCPNRNSARHFSWRAFDELTPWYGKIIARNQKALDLLLPRWDVEFKCLGFEHDPTHRDWQTFRSLRLSREEDWSDWLAFLIESSTSGDFSKQLLRIQSLGASDYVSATVKREDPTHIECRPDIIINWNKRDFYSHIEVKIGDPDMAKIFPECETLMNHTSGSWSHYILLQKEQVKDWQFIDAMNPQPFTVTLITWDDVCVALRKTLLRKELIIWKAWAYAFLGAVEQKIVGFHGYRTRHDYANADRKCAILEEGLKSVD